MQRSLQGPLKLDGGEETKIFDLVKNRAVHNSRHVCTALVLRVVHDCRICGIPYQRTEDRLHIRRVEVDTVDQGGNSTVSWHSSAF